MRVLITGAGGFIGSHLVERCRELGYSVIGIDRKPLTSWLRGTKDLPGKLSEYSIDVTHLQFADCLIYEEFDLCFHLAAESRIQPSFIRPVFYVMNNVQGTANVLGLCACRSARMVYAGSSTADDDVAKNIYATTKLQGEMLCRAWSQCFDLQVNSARFFNVYGPRQIETGEYATVVGIFERQYRSGGQLTVTGNGQHRRDFTAVEDIVEGLLAVAERGDGTGTTYALGRGRNWSILDVARLFVDELHRIRFIPRPPGESERTLCDVETTAREIGWRAERNLDQYIMNVKLTIDAARDQDVHT